MRNYGDASVEQAGIDRVTYQNTALLHTSFGTPLGRDDIHRLISRMQSAVALLSNMKNAPEALKICQEIGHAESRAYQLMGPTISRLFREESDTSQLIKLKAIHELLEAVTAKCHDAANSIATMVSTRVLKPYQAVVWAAFFNFLAIYIFEPKVAATIGKGIVSPEIVDPAVIFGALVGAVAWNVITWNYGIPVSTTHTITGAILGAGSVRNPVQVRWRLATNLVYAWILTLPAAGLLAAAAHWIGSGFVPG